MPTQYPDLYDENGQALENRRRLPLYCAVCYLLHEQFPLADVSALVTVNPNESIERPGAPVAMALNVLPEAFARTKLDEKTRLLVLAVYGGMLMANMDDPSLGRPPEAARGQNEIIIDIPYTWIDSLGEPVEQLRVRIMPRFVEEFTRAVQSYTVNQRMFAKVLSYLKHVGAPPEAHGSSDSRSNVFAEQLAKVVQRLVEQKVSPDAPQLRLQIQSCVDATVTAACSTTGCGTGGRYSNVDLDLPDLASEMSAEIYPDNVRAQSVLYFSAQLEDMRLFAVADEVAHQFAMGLLPITRGAAGDNIFEYIKCAPNRFTEAERRGFYARAFGFTQGGADTSDPNREFSTLWIRALSAVSNFNRQNSAGYVEEVDYRAAPLVFNVDQRRIPMMQVFKSMRDLSINLSLHGFAMAHYSAVELQQTIMQIRNMLSHPDVLSAFGVRDYFQLIERVSRMYMNSDINTMRQRVLAQSGSRIIQWLADRSEVLASPHMPHGRLFMDPELTTNVERWLAVTGTTGATIDRYSEPSATPPQSTIPNLQMMRGAVQKMEHTLNTLDRAAAGGTPPSTPAEA